MRGDPARARSLMEAASEDIGIALQLPGTKAARRTIVRNVYEAFRMLGEARLALAGIRSADHDTQIRELLRLDMHVSRPLQAIESLKQLHHAVNYRGYVPEEAEVEEALALAGELFAACREAVEAEIERF